MNNKVFTKQEKRKFLFVGLSEGNKEYLNMIKRTCKICGGKTCVMCCWTGWRTGSFMYVKTKVRKDRIITLEEL